MAINDGFSEKCPLCDGDTVRDIRKLEFVYKGRPKTINQPGRYCLKCGEGILSPSDTLSTQREIADFHKQTDGLLTSEELKKARTTLKLTQKKAGELFGGGPMAFSKYERGEITQSLSTDTLIRLLIKGKVKMEDLSEIRQGHM
jgi:HTH-type transcriptional regulator/antitoxin MqsA